MVKRLERETNELYSMYLYCIQSLSLMYPVMKNSQDSEELQPFYRYGITFKEVSGESEKVTKEITASWEETTVN